jgi:hypothetical protein
MSAVEDLLRGHLRGIREAIAESTARADALEALVNRLAEQDAPVITAEPLDHVRRHNGWSEEEDALLREHYPFVGAPGCTKLLPHRSALAIRVRATRSLKLARQSGPGVNKAKAACTWCDQCEHRVSAFQIATCQSPFCAVKAKAA